MFRNFFRIHQKSITKTTKNQVIFGNCFIVDKMSVHSMNPEDLHKFNKISEDFRSNPKIFQSRQKSSGNSGKRHFKDASLTIDR